MDGGKSTILTLKVKDANSATREIASNSNKAEAFHKAFFPPIPAVSLVPANFIYPAPLSSPPIISRDQIQRHVTALSPFKASGPDGIPNIVLHKSLDYIKNHLEMIYQAIIRLGTYVDSWREFTTVVLRKPGKPNYELPKAHQPIALICTMAKVLTAIVAEDISYLVEKETLLPMNHYGGRSGRMTMDAIHVLIDKQSGIHSLPRCRSGLPKRSHR